MDNIEIEKFEPCREALEFRKKFSSFKEAWNECRRGDWMLWIAKKTEVDEKLLFKAKALCAKTVIHLMKDERSKKAIQATLDYSEGKISKDQLIIYAADAAAYATYAAAAAAADAAADADAAAAAYAAAAAAYAAYAADAAAYAADAAADAADAAADADAAAAAAYAADAAADAAAAKIENQKKTADICREVLTSEILKKLS